MFIPLLQFLFLFLIQIQQTLSLPNPNPNPAPNPNPPNHKSIPQLIKKQFSILSTPPATKQNDAAVSTFYFPTQTQGVLGGSNSGGVITTFNAVGVLTAETRSKSGNVQTTELIVAGNGGGSSGAPTPTLIMAQPATATTITSSAMITQTVIDLSAGSSSSSPSLTSVSPTAIAASASVSSTSGGERVVGGRGVWMMIVGGVLGVVGLGGLLG